jgi:hypothetical protein
MVQSDISQGSNGRVEEFLLSDQINYCESQEQTHLDLNFIHISWKVGNNDFVDRLGCSCGSRGFGSGGSGSTSGGTGPCGTEKLGFGSCTSATANTTTSWLRASSNDLDILF